MLGVAGVSQINKVKQAHVQKSQPVYPSYVSRPGAPAQPSYLIKSLVLGWGGGLTRVLNCGGKALRLSSRGLVLFGVLSGLMFTGCKDEPVDYAQMSPEQLQERAAQADVTAQLTLGNAYAQGHYAQGQLVELDLTKAQAFWEQAAAQGNAEAQFNLGELLYKGSTKARFKTDSQAALHWYEQAAAQGHGESCYQLGVLYEKGRGIHHDFHQAFKWYEQAALQGIKESQFALATMYERGRGVRQDEQQALNWYTKAAEQGHAEALFKLGAIWQRGRWVEKDLPKAQEFYGQACDNGLQQGCDAYRRLKNQLD